MLLRDEQSIKKYIKNQEKSGCCFVYGDESYLSQFYAKSLASSVTDISAASFNYTYFDSDNASFDAVHEACETLPVMSERVCVFVKDLPFMKLPQDELKQYLDYLESLPPTAVLIFLMADIAVDIKQNQKWKTIIDAFDKHGVVFCLSKRSDNAVAELLVRSASKRNTVISRDSAEYFISIVGSDMNLLLNEFDKLCAYSAGQEITRQMIDNVAVRSVEASVFDLTKAINSGKNDRAFEILTALIKDKTDPLMILGALVMEYTDMYRAKTAAANRGNTADLLKSFSGYKNKSFRLDKAGKNAERLSISQIKKQLQALSDADIKIKSFSTDNNIVLQELLAKLIYITGEKS